MAARKCKIVPPLGYLPPKWNSNWFLIKILTLEKESRTPVTAPTPNKNESVSKKKKKDTSQKIKLIFFFPPAVLAKFLPPFDFFQG